MDVPRREKGFVPNLTNIPIFVTRYLTPIIELYLTIHSAPGMYIDKSGL